MNAVRVVVLCVCLVVFQACVTESKSGSAVPSESDAAVANTNLCAGYLRQGKPDLAIATYERYLETPWQARVETDDVDLGFAMKRLGELYQQQNERAKAAAQYSALLKLWRGADSELEPLLTDVKRRLEQVGN